MADQDPLAIAVVFLFDKRAPFLRNEASELIRATGARERRVSAKI